MKTKFRLSSLLFRLKVIWLVQYSYPYITGLNNYSVLAPTEISYPLVTWEAAITRSAVLHFDQSLIVQ